MTWSKFQGFVGPSYPLKSKAIDAQRLINMYPEMIESGAGKEGQVAYLKSIPGYESIFTAGAGPLRLVYVDNRNRVFIVSGSALYKATHDGTSWTVTNIFTLDTSTGHVKAASTSFVDPDDTTIYTDVTVFVDGTNNYLYQYNSPADTEAINTFSNFGYPGVVEATNVIWIDGFFIFNKPNSGFFYVSDYNSFGVDPLSFASSEGDPDKVVSFISNHRDLIMLNERSTEVFVNTGNADFPFERVQGGFIEKGCLAPHSVAKIDSKVFWLSRDEFGQGNIQMLQGMVPQRVSTHAVEQKISTYTNIEDATAYAYQKEGHNFYVINFTEGSWCFDVSTGQWHERLSLLNGALQRNRLEYLKFFPFLGIHIAADFEENIIYKLNDDLYTFGTEPIVKERTFPHISASGLQMRCNALRIDMEVGVGINGTAQGSDPMAMLKWSDDDGRTWSNERTASIGKIGETFKRVIFWRLGTYRKRIYKLRITDPVKVNILSVDVDIEVGAN